MIGPMQPRVASFIGWSNTGKTGFIEAALIELRRRGVEAAAVKFVRHPGAFNLPGKDSTRFGAAGAAAALAADDELVITRRPPARWDRSALAGLFPGAKAMLLEGRVVPGAYRVLVAGPAREEAELKKPLTEFDALVTDDPGLAELARGRSLTVFPTDGVAAFVDTLLGGLDMAERKLTIMNDGQEVPLNPFVEETFANVVLGLFKSLKKVNPDGEIVIRLEAED